MNKYSKEQINRGVFKGVKKVASFECEQDYINFCLDIILEITLSIETLRTESTKIDNNKEQKR